VFCWTCIDVSGPGNFFKWVSKIFSWRLFSYSCSKLCLWHSTNKRTFQSPSHYNVSGIFAPVGNVKMDFIPKFLAGRWTAFELFHQFRPTFIVFCVRNNRFCGSTRLCIALTFSNSGKEVMFWMKIIFTHQNSKKSNLWRKNILVISTRDFHRLEEIVVTLNVWRKVHRFDHAMWATRRAGLPTPYTMSTHP